MLPNLELDPLPRLRWFRPHGCVEAREDGSFAVYVGGSLIGTFTARCPAGRDVLMAVVMEDARTRPGEIAQAFRVSAETVRRARLRAERGGLAQVSQGRQRGAPSKLTPALRRRLYQLFELGLSGRAVLGAIRRKVSYSTVLRARQQWQAERETTDQESASAAQRAVAATAVTAAANDTVGEVESESEAVGRGEACREAEKPESKPELTGDGQRVVAAPTGTAAANDAVVEEESRTAQWVEAQRAKGKRQSEPVAAGEAEFSAETGRRELSLEEATAGNRGQTVQHAGTWIMLGMLQAMGLYAIAKAACRGAVPPVALRVSLDAVAIALSLGQRCVEGVRRLATPSAALLLRARGAISASWARRVLKRFAKPASVPLHLAMARGYLERAQREDRRVVLYVDNHLRPYTGQHTLRKGWRMQDKRARPGVSDYYVHDEAGRPLFRIDDPTHRSLTQWLRPVAEFVRSVLGSETIPVLAFDRGGAFPEEMAALRETGVEFTTYERAPYAQYTHASFNQTVTLTRESNPDEPVVIRFTDERHKNLGKGRGRLRRIAMQMPDGQQVNLLSASTLPSEELIRIQLQRWGCQENQFKHGNERWAINQLDGRRVQPYPADAIIPNPERSRIERDLRLARAAEGQARNKLARLDRHDPKRPRVEKDLQHALELQEQLEALRPHTPTHAPVCETELRDELVQHDGAYKTVIDTLRIALANAETDLASQLAPHLRKPREAKKTLASLLAAAGTVRLTRRTVTVSLAPAATSCEREAFTSLLKRISAMNLTLPGDASRRRLVFKLHT
jgi:hypothetical protein